MIGYGEQKGIGDHLIFYGRENDAAKIYSSLDILANTSIYADMPVPIIEAMVSLVPVITTGTGGVKELLGNYNDLHVWPNGFKLCERGILCINNDPVVFANGIEFMIRNGFRSDFKMLFRAREFILSNYCSNRIEKKIEEMYSKLIMDLK